MSRSGGQSSSGSSSSRTKFLNDYIDGSEAAAVQRAAIQTAITDAAASGKELRYGTPRSGASEWLVDRALTVVAPKTRHYGMGAKIRQTAWGDVASVLNDHDPATQIFDVQELADETLIEDFELRYTGARVNAAIAGIGSYRQDQSFLVNGGIQVLANGCKIHTIKVYGRVVGVYFSNYKLASNSKTGYQQDNTLDGLEVDACDFGVLAIGQDGLCLRDISGTYSISTDTGGGAIAPHLVYISDNQPNKNIVGGDWRARNGGLGFEGHGFTIKGIVGGELKGLVANACGGTLAMTNNQGLRIVGLRGVNDQGTQYAVQFTSSGNTDVEIDGLDLEKNAITAKINMDGSRNKIRGSIRTNAGGTAGADVLVSGADHLLDLDYRNTNANGSRAVEIRGTNCGVRLNRCIGSKRPFDIKAAATNSWGWIDGANVTNPSDVFNPSSSVSEPTGEVRQAPFRNEITISGAGTTTLDPSIQDQVVLKVTTTAAITVTTGAFRSTRDVKIEIYNNSGGTLGTITWGAAFVGQTALPTGATGPANGKRMRLAFQWDDATSKFIENSARQTLP